MYHAQTYPSPHTTATINGHAVVIEGNSATITPPNGEPVVVSLMPDVAAAFQNGVLDLRMADITSKALFATAPRTLGERIA